MTFKLQNLISKHEAGGEADTRMKQDYQNLLLSLLQACFMLHLASLASSVFTFDLLLLLRLLHKCEPDFRIT